MRHECIVCGAQQPARQFLCPSCLLQWKRCSGCTRILSLDHFIHSRNHSGGRYAYCRLCAGVQRPLAIRRERLAHAMRLLDQGMNYSDVSQATGYAIDTLRCRRCVWRKNSGRFVYSPPRRKPPLPAKEKIYRSPESITRDVWKAITATPSALAREIAQCCGISESRARTVLRVLQDKGYIVSYGWRDCDVLMPYREGVCT